MTGAGIVAIGGMMIRPRWVLPLPDLAAPTFLFRASANRLKLIFSTHNHEYFRNHLLDARPHRAIRDTPPSIYGGRIALEMGRVTVITIMEDCSPARVPRSRVAIRTRRKRRAVHGETPSTHGSEGRQRHHAIVRRSEWTGTCGQKAGTRSRAFSERFPLRGAASREYDRTRRRGKAGAYSYGIRNEGEYSEGQAEPIGSRRSTMGGRTDLPRPPTTAAPSRTARGATSTRTS